MVLVGGAFSELAADVDDAAASSVAGSSAVVVVVVALAAASGAWGVATDGLSMVTLRLSRSTAVAAPCTKLSPVRSPSNRGAT